MLSTLYLPVLLMLIAPGIARGVVRVPLQGENVEHIWGVCFAVGSIAAAFAQGLMLGAIVEGMPLQGGEYLRGAFAWFSPFSMRLAVAVVFGYALLSSTWLIVKTGGALQNVATLLTGPGRGRRRVHGPGEHLAAVPQQQRVMARLVRKRQLPVALAGAAASARECRGYGERSCVAPNTCPSSWR